MGVRIGEVAPRPVQQEPRPKEAQVNRPGRPGPFAQEGHENPANILFGSAREDPLRIGFGEGTVSMPGLTMRAIDSNMKGARRIVPSLEETREEVRERLADQRDLFARETRAAEPVAREPQSLGFAQGEALARTRSRQLINALDAAAATTPPPLRGEGGPAPVENEPTIRIGDEMIAAQRPTGGPTFDVHI